MLLIGCSAPLVKFHRTPSFWQRLKPKIASARWEREREGGKEGRREGRREGEGGGEGDVKVDHQDLFILGSLALPFAGCPMATNPDHWIP